METSLRYGGDAKAFRIHAKQKLPLDSKTHLQVHGELDTRVGVPTFLRAVVRRFYPDELLNFHGAFSTFKRTKMSGSNLVMTCWTRFHICRSGKTIGHSMPMVMENGM